MTRGNSKTRTGGEAACLLSEGSYADVLFRQWGGEGGNLTGFTDLAVEVSIRGNAERPSFDYSGGEPVAIGDFAVKCLQTPTTPCQSVRNHAAVAL